MREEKNKQIINNRVLVYKIGIIKDVSTHSLYFVSCSFIQPFLIQKSAFQEGSGPRIEI